MYSDKKKYMKINSQVFEDILQDIVTVALLQLRRSWVIQQDNRCKRQSKSTTKWLKRAQTTTQ